MITKTLSAYNLKEVVLYERFNIDWLIRQVNGGNLPIFYGRTRQETLEILNNFKKQGYKTIRNTRNGIIAEYKY